MSDLSARWASVAGTSAAARAAGEALLARWAEPHRRYHDTAHLAAVLDAVDLLAADAGPEVDLAAVRLAAWFHDAIYDGRPGDDEEASAALAEAVLPGLGVPAGRVAEVGRLVRLTATHAPALGDAAGALLCDADLAVLGGAPDDYARYAAAIREEYADVPADAFRAGRAAVLERLLAREPLFATARGRELWEAAARRNLSAELARLRG